MAAFFTIELLEFLPGKAVAIWPAAGIALFSVLKWGNIGAFGVFVGASAFYLHTYHNDGWLFSDSHLYPIVGLLATGNLMQALFGSFLIKRFVGFPNSLIEDKAIIKFLLLSGPIGCLIAPSWDISLLVLFKEIHAKDFYTSWFIWWVGDSSGVIIFTPILIILFDKRKNIREIRRITVVLPLIIILLGLYFFQYQNNKLELRKQKLEFQQSVAEIKRDIDQHLYTHIEVLFLIKSFFDSSIYVSRKAFYDFTSSILTRHHDIQALEWIEKVTHDQREYFIAAIREEGFSDFNIYQIKDDKLIIAEESEEYFVINYVVPLEKNQTAFGYDIKSNPNAKQAAYNALYTGKLAATKPIRLVQETQDKMGFVMYIPVYQRNVELITPQDRLTYLKGFIAVVFRIEDMVSEILSNAKTEYMSIVISDESLPGDNKILSINNDVYDIDKNTIDIAWKSDINVADQIWTANFYPSRTYISQHISSDNQLMQGTNHLISFLLVAWLLTISGRNFRTEQIVSQRTKDLRHEIEQRSRVEEQLSYHASHDMLTGLINRREFEIQLNRFLKNPSDNRNTNHVLCMMDLDRFKIVNDSCGHIAGDELLRQVSKLLNERIRHTDILARLGGDEFGLLLQDCPTNEALLICDDMLKKIEEYKFVWQKRSFSIGISIGMVVLDRELNNITDLLKDADDACYIAKEMGRNRVHLSADDDKTARRRGEIEWVNKINYALENNQFCLDAQRIQSVNNKDDMYELLIRMTDDNGNKIAPGYFLTAAERYNLVEKIDYWVVKHAFESIKDKDDFPILSINLSGNSLSNSGLLFFIKENMIQFKIPENKICFEITETSAIGNIADAEEFIHTLKRMGCVFALDDFGSGFSSFAYLKTLPVDYLKIDGSFVKDILTDEMDYAMVKSINEIGHVIGKKTIAEFVESKEILSCLREMGIDYVQGYGISHPVPFETIFK